MLLQKLIYIDDTFEYTRKDIESIDEKFDQNDNLIHNARNQLKIIKLGDLNTVVKSFKIPNAISISF